MFNNNHYAEVTYKSSATQYNTKLQTIFFCFISKIWRWYNTFGFLW